MALAAQFPLLSLAGSLGDDIVWNSKTVEAKKLQLLAQSPNWKKKKNSDNNSDESLLRLQLFWKISFPRESEN